MLIGVKVLWIFIKKSYQHDEKPHSCQSAIWNKVNTPRPHHVCGKIT